MVQIINGKKIAEVIKDEIVQEIYKFEGQRPNLAIILIGEREDSRLYVSLKRRQAKFVGIDTHFYHLAENTTEKEILEVIDFLNKDKLIDGILVQLPLPKHLNADKIINSIDCKKDVDGFHEESLKKIDKDGVFLSPVFASILRVLQEISYKLENKQVAIIYNSLIFGSGLAKLINNRKGKPVLIQKNEIEFKKNQICQSDVIITALGLPNFLNESYIKQGVVLIDVGISKLNTKVCGDINLDRIKGLASYITPVPGGIGPMTIAMLFKNTLEAFKKNIIK